jgi:predicted RNase H-like HicB family nuclease
MSGAPMEYLVVVEKGQRSYGAYVPDLPGCVAVGKTRREVKRLIREAISMHLEALKESGDKVPVPTSRSELVKVQAMRNARGSLKGIDTTVLRDSDRV